ncbi:MAG: glutamate--tRNA ligase [Burkholderiaceae bacterium]
MTPVRTRIAPSPTGMLHLGTARTALYCWAHARHHGGTFVLRIEDTDRERSTAEATQVILDSMAWLDLDYDEGPIYQMDRLARYQELVAQMLADGHAYPCYASREELDAMREQQRAHGEKPRYDGRWRPENAAGRAVPEGVVPVIRFRNPDHGEVSWQDAVYGLITIGNSELDDLVIMRGDGVPTYNFAVVVDDIDMAISHVIRGADHINNTPRQINMYRALGATVPVFAHLPLIHGPDGEKLSKRHGAVSVMAYAEQGYLPEALFNYLARLGWGHGDAEKFSREQMAEWFELGNVSRAPSQFSPEKLLWLNHEYMKQADDGRLASLVAPRIETRGGKIEGGPELVRVVALLKDRARTLEELADAAMLFYGPVERDSALVAQHLDGVGAEAVKLFAQRAADIAWERGAISLAIKAVVGELKIKMPQIAIPLRVVVTGRTQTPAIDATLELVGREAVLARIESVLSAAA